MSEKIQGTVILDGLIEGRTPEFDDAEDRLRQWIGKVRGKGLAFGLEIEGATFSVLADNRPVSIALLGSDPADAITEALRDLLLIFPPPMRTSLVSSIRSIEYGQNVEIQTVYAVNADGQIETRQRTVDARTTAPPEPLTRREKLKLGGMGLIVALGIFAISAIWVDYGALFSKYRDKLTPYDPDAMVVETGDLARYFTIEKRAIVGENFVLTVKRTKAFPTDDKALNALFAETRGRADCTISAAMTVEALARGYIRCEMFNKKDKCFHSFELRIVNLRTKETLALKLPLSRDHHLTRVAIRY